MITTWLGAALACLLLCEAASPALDVPLIVQELLPADDSGERDVVGRKRDFEPVTSGIPLRDADAVADTTHLAVLDSTTGRVIPSQFRVLSRHPSGNIQWVLVDTQADVAPNGATTLHLVNGNDPGGPALARDAGAVIQIDTGPARFAVRKAEQNVLDFAVVGERVLLREGNRGGILHQDADGQEYRSTADTHSTAVIEENGPLRAVVKETGLLVNEHGDASFGYTARLTFYKGKSYVKALVIIENARLESRTRKSVGGIEIQLPLALEAPLSFTLAGKTGSFDGALERSENVYLYQACTTHKESSHAVRAPGARRSFFQEESDWGTPFTAAQLDAPLPQPGSGQRSVYPGEIVGTALVLSVDGGPDRRITFDRSRFRNPARPLAGEIATAIRNEFRGLGGKFELEASIIQDSLHDSGILRIRSLGRVGRPSIVVKAGTASPILGFREGARSEGQNGFRVVHGTRTLHDFEGSEDYSRGFGDLSDSTGRGLAVAVRDFDSFFPSGVTFSGTGELNVEIYSSRNTRKGLLFDWEVHETREIMLDLHASRSDPELTHYRIQYPLFARAPYEQYRDSRAFLGRERLVDFEDMREYHARNVLNGINQFAAANRDTYGVAQYELPNQQIVRTRSYNWASGGRQTNNDQTVPKLLGYLATGKGGLFHAAYNLLRFVADQAIRHSDRSDRAVWPLRSKDVERELRPPAWDLVNGGTGKFELDMEHMNVLGLPLLYYLTGDESLRDAMIDLGEWLLRDGPVVRGRCGAGGRGHAQASRWHAVLWRLTGDPRHKERLDELADFYLCGAMAGPAKGQEGQDQARGFFFRPRPGQRSAPRQVSSPKDNIRFEGIWEVMHTLPENDPRKEELADRLLGYAYFVALEYYFDRKGSLCYAFGGPQRSEYDLDAAPPPDEAWSQASGFDWTLAMAHGYRMSGDPRFLYVGRRIAGTLAGSPRCAGAPGGAPVRSIRQGYVTYDNWTVQDFLYTDTHRDDYRSLLLTEKNGLHVDRTRDGSPVLRWVVPEGATRYQIKYGPRPMVANLDFDRLARSYSYLPTEYDNFWAGPGSALSDRPRNLTDEPLHEAPGTEQSYTVVGVDPSRASHFAMRVLSTGGLATERAATTPIRDAATLGNTPEQNSVHPESSSRKCMNGHAFPLDWGGVSMPKGICDEYVGTPVRAMHGRCRKTPIRSTFDLRWWMSPTRLFGQLFPSRGR